MEENKEKDGKRKKKRKRWAKRTKISGPRKDKEERRKGGRGKEDK